ncbi:glycosyl hydrolase 2 galactose-binding domain-containing protein [Dactylosporangium sp. CA-233914]|uniref:glycoside hydrolase family 2 protein n=1 Tax=Dactylosporangium sp. CA-233914 TaxID=3239934 RepID=UPI003D901F79
MSAVRSVRLDTWTVRAVGGPYPQSLAHVTVPATVPGSVHTDLMAAGLLADPYLDENEKQQSWVGLTDWVYDARFDWQPGADRAELVFEGLDTIATVLVNGVVVAQTRNMHRRYRIDVSAVVRPGPNDLQVRFAAPIPAADLASVELGYRPHVNHHPYNAIRKMACSFGWDWGPDLATSGMWKPASLQTWSTARIVTSRPVAALEGSTGVVDLVVEVDRADANAELEVLVSSGMATATAIVASGSSRAVLRLEIPAVARWWPAGLGDQTLYDIVVSLRVAGDEIDSRTHRVGFRSVRLEQDEDDFGRSFRILVNETPISVRGANWIPDDAFPHRVDRERYRHRLEQALFGRINLLRVWGGGIYESEDFYDLCDEMGILTWQDFLTTCAAYAEDELWSEFEAEARDNVTRLAPHPSLIMLNGTNESIWGHEDWRWKPRLDGRTWGYRLYHELFPQIVAELAPHVLYTPGSPFSPDGSAHPNDPAQGTVHVWDVWNELDYTAYRSKTARFVSEFGWQAPPTMSTLTESIHDRPLTPESPGMLLHQKALDGNVKLIDGLAPHLRVPDEIGDWHWATSLNQAAAITVGIERFRALPECAGTVVWQLNDCWPVTSWAAVDGYGRPKPLLYAMRHAHANRLLTFQGAGELHLVAVNDTSTPWNETVTLSRRRFDGEELASAVVELSVAAFSKLWVPLDEEVAVAEDSAGEYVRARSEEGTARWFFAEYRDSDLRAGTLKTEMQRVGDRYRLTLRSEHLVRDVCLLVDQVDPDAVASDMLVTLDPGASATIEFTSARDISYEQLTASSVLRSANDLVDRS